MISDPPYVAFPSPFIADLTLFRDLVCVVSVGFNSLGREAHAVSWSRLVEKPIESSLTLRREIDPSNHRAEPMLRFMWAGLFFGPWGMVEFTIYNFEFKSACPSTMSASSCILSWGAFLPNILKVRKKSINILNSSPDTSPRLRKHTKGHQKRAMRRKQDRERQRYGPTFLIKSVICLSISSWGFNNSSLRGNTYTDIQIC